MREALASAAQQPLHVALHAARLTSEAVHQAEEGGRRLGHKDAADYDSSELYHESSVQMRNQEQQHRATTAPGVQAEEHKQASHGALTAAGGLPGKEGDAAASAASTTSQEAGNSEQEISHGLAENGRGEGRPDEKAMEMSASDEDDATSSVPGMSASDGPDISGSGVHTYKHYRGVLLFLWIAEIVGLTMLIQEFTLKMTDPDGAYRNKSVPVINVVFGSLCWAALTATLLIYIMRFASAWRQGKQWKPRRKKLATLLITELVAQWINVTFFLVPNINLLAHPCDIWSILVPYCAIIRWSCWNTIFLITVVQAHNVKPYWKCEAQGFAEWFASQTGKNGFVRKCLSQRGPFKESMRRRNEIPGRFEGAVIDAPWTVHAPKLIIWHAFPVYKIYKMNECYILRGDISCKITNTQLRVRLLVVAFYTLAIPLLWYVRINSCRSYMYTWYGLLPLQVVETAAAVTWSFFAMPAVHVDDDTPALQVWLQEFAWTEDEKEAKIERRNRDGPKGRQLAKEPMFCFEFAMSMLYWSALVYDYGEVERGITLDVGMKLFGLEHSELFWEKALDTKLLMSWNNNRILIAFRGTASLANALADVQAWRTVHPPPRGRWGRRPLVHVGFLRSWLRNGLDMRVKSRVMEIIQSPDFHPTFAHVVVTGHSLGGALAQLAAHDIAREAQSCGKSVRVGCYTYGSPRVGNHAFAREFDQVVPHCWHIINNQDAVARAPKFLVLYKRAGQRVLINKNGDMLVRPAFIENSILQLPGGGSVADHLLGSYLRSLLAVLLVQFTRKGFPSGMEGALHLVERSPPIQELLLDGAGISVDDLRRLTRWHGQVVNPRLARATAGQLITAMQARHKKIVKEAQAAKARNNQLAVEAKEMEAGKAPEAVAAAERPPEEKKEAVEDERLSLWQRIKRRLLVWMLVGPTAEEYTGNVGSRSMPTNDAGTSSDNATSLDKASVDTLEGPDTASGNADLNDRRQWP
ncbi:g5737 [Coccomyxa elongata]